MPRLLHRLPRPPQSIPQQPMPQRSRHPSPQCLCLMQSAHKLSSIFENGTERQHTKRSQFFSQLNDRHRLMSQLLHKKRILLESILRRPTSTATSLFPLPQLARSTSGKPTRACLCRGAKQNCGLSVATVAHFFFFIYKKSGLLAAYQACQNLAASKN